MSDESNRLLKLILEQAQKTDERIDTIANATVENTSNLKEHMRRTAILEEDFKPIRAHVTLVNNIGKVISACAAVALFAKSMGLF